VAKGTIGVLAIHNVRPIGVNAKDLVVFATPNVIIVVYVVINKANK